MINYSGEEGIYKHQKQLRISLNDRINQRFRVRNISNRRILSLFKIGSAISIYLEKNEQQQ